MWNAASSAAAARPRPRHFSPHSRLFHGQRHGQRRPPPGRVHHHLRAIQHGRDKPGMLGGQRILGALRNVGTPDLRDGQQIDRTGDGAGEASGLRQLVYTGKPGAGGRVRFAVVRRGFLWKLGSRRLHFS